MNRWISRIVVPVLVPCLMADPITVSAIAFLSSSPAVVGGGSIRMDPGLKIAGMTAGVITSQALASVPTEFTRNPVDSTPAEIAKATTVQQSFTMGSLQAFREFGQPPKREAGSKPFPKFKDGESASHPLFGLGTVVKVTVDPLHPDDQVVDVRFRDGHIYRFWNGQLAAKENATPKIAALFPSVSSENPARPQVAQRLYETYPFMRELYDQAQSASGLPLDALMLSAVAPHDPMQMLLVNMLYSVALYRWWEVESSNGVKPLALAGQSIGTLAAMVVGEALTVEEAIACLHKASAIIRMLTTIQRYGVMKIVGARPDVQWDSFLVRGRVMLLQNASPAYLTFAIWEGADIPRQITRAKAIAGPNAKVTYDATPLDSRGWHTPFVNSLRNPIKALIDASPMKNSQIPIVSASRTGGLLQSAVELRAELQRLLFVPVYWTEAIHQLKSLGIGTLIEFGCGDRLTEWNKVMARNLDSMHVHDLISTLTAHPEIPPDKPEATVVASLETQSSSAGSPESQANTAEGRSGYYPFAGTYYVKGSGEKDNLILRIPSKLCPSREGLDRVWVTLETVDKRRFIRISTAPPLKSRDQKGRPVDEQSRLTIPYQLADDIPELWKGAYYIVGMNDAFEVWPEAERNAYHASQPAQEIFSDSTVQGLPLDTNPSKVTKNHSLHQIPIAVIQYLGLEKDIEQPLILEVGENGISIIPLADWLKQLQQNEPSELEAKKRFLRSVFPRAFHARISKDQSDLAFSEAVRRLFPINAGDRIQFFRAGTHRVDLRIVRATDPPAEPAGLTAIRNPDAEKDPARLERYVRQEAPRKETLRYIGGGIIAIALAVTGLVGLGIFLSGLWSENPSGWWVPLSCVFYIVAALMIPLSARDFAKDHGAWIYDYQEQANGAAAIVPVALTRANEATIQKFLRRRGRVYGYHFLGPALAGGFILDFLGASFAVNLCLFGAILLLSLVNAWRAHRQWNNLPFGSEKDKAKFADKGGWFAAILDPAGPSLAAPATEINPSPMALSEDAINRFILSSTDGGMFVKRSTYNRYPRLLKLGFWGKRWVEVFLAPFIEVSDIMGMLWAKYLEDDEDFERKASDFIDKLTSESNEQRGNALVGIISAGVRAAQWGLGIGWTTRFAIWVTIVVHLARHNLKTRQAGLTREPSAAPASHVQGSKGFIKGEDVSEEEVAVLLKEIERDSPQVRNAHLNAVEIVKAVCHDFLSKKEAELRRALKVLGLTPDEIDGVVKKLQAPDTYFKWFKAIVRDQEWYVLGQNGALAVNAVTTLWAAENQGSDKHLVVEYVLHEVLENTFLEHNQIVQFTTRFFERSAYTSPRETPVGGVLRKMINDELIIQWDYERLMEAAEERRLWLEGRPLVHQSFRREFRLTSDGRIDIEGPYFVEVEWKKNGHLIFTRTETVQMRHGAERHVSYAGELPINFETAKDRYHEAIDRNSLQWDADAENVKDLMIAARPADGGERQARWNEWLQIVTRNPGLLRLVLEELEKTPDELNAAVQSLVDAYHGAWRTPINTLFESLASTNKRGLESVLKAVKKGVDGIISQERRYKLNDDFYENATNLEVDIQSILDQSPETSSVRPSGFQKWRPLIIVGMMVLSAWSLAGKHVEAAMATPLLWIQRIEARHVRLNGMSAAA